MDRFTGCLEEEGREKNKNKNAWKSSETQALKTEMLVILLDVEDVFIVMLNVVSECVP